MSLSICADCLSRLRISPRTFALNAVVAPPALATRIPRASFHISASLSKSPLAKAKTGKVTMKHRVGMASRLKKKIKERPRPPPIGERKTQRQRIVLSNTNALEVAGMQDLDLHNMADRACVGKVLGLQGPVLDQLRDAKAFKTNQNWSLFRRPATLVRNETVTLAEEMQAVLDGWKKGEPATLQRLVVGGRSSGKSILQLQAMYMGFLNKFVVISIPEAAEYTRNTFAYAPIPSRDGAIEQTYSQSTLASELLQRAANANESVLGGLKLNHPLPKNIRLEKGDATMLGLALAGARDPILAHSAWKAFWTELTTSGDNSRPPVLISIDGIDHWMGVSKYRAADYRLVHAQQLYIVRQMTNTLFANTSSLAHGGLVLATTSASNSPAFENFDILLKQMRFVQGRAAKANNALPDPANMTAGVEGMPVPPAYFKSDDRVLGLLSKAQKTKLSGLGGVGKPESKGLLEYFARSGLFQREVSEGTVSELWGLSSGGLVGELARLGARIRT